MRRPLFWNGLRLSACDAINEACQVDGKFPWKRGLNERSECKPDRAQPVNNRPVAGLVEAPHAQISASVGTFLPAMTLPIRDTFMRCL